jgi:hypothetical protein
VDSVNSAYAWIFEFRQRLNVCASGIFGNLMANFAEFGECQRKNFQSTLDFSVDKSMNIADPTPGGRDTDCPVQGISHSMTTERHAVTFLCASSFDASYFR